MIVKYLDKDIELKYSFRGYIIYENIMGESFKSNGMKELLVLYYSMLVAADPEAVHDFDQFIVWVDEHPETVNEFSQWLVKNISRNNDTQDTNIEKTENTEAPDPKKE